MRPLAADFKLHDTIMHGAVCEHTPFLAVELIRCSVFDSILGPVQPIAADAR